MSALYETYRKKVVPLIKEQFGYRSVMQVPTIKKVTLNMGVGASFSDKKRISAAQMELCLIAGQQPVVTRARKSVAGFKIRQGFPIGCKVTLRKERMWSFLQRLISIAMPRIRDFRGLNPNSFDDAGNYSLGIRENLIFPEIDYDKVEHLHGLDVCITTSATDVLSSRSLLSALGFPFRKQQVGA